MTFQEECLALLKKNRFELLSVKIFARCDNFSERGSATRSTLESERRSKLFDCFPGETLLRVTDPRSATL